MDPQLSAFLDALHHDPGGGGRLDAPGVFLAAPAWACSRVGQAEFCCCPAAPIRP